MEIHYMDGGPFETSRKGESAPVVVLAYDSESRHFLYVYTKTVLFHAGSASADRFDPPPPIPAAAREPQSGEVWVMQAAVSQKHVARLIIRPSSTGYDTFTPEMDLDWYSSDWIVRPATPEEAEPFRRIMDGLKRSLGEA